MTLRRSSRIQKAYTALQLANRKLLTAIREVLYTGRVVFYQEGYSEHISSWVPYEIVEIRDWSIGRPLATIERVGDHNRLVIPVLDGRIKIK